VIIDFEVKTTTSGFIRTQKQLKLNPNPAGDYLNIFIGKKTSVYAGTQ
jgi:hypothetical protein